MARPLRRKKGLLGPKGRLSFVDAAHLRHQAVPGHGWIKRKRTVELKTNSGRNRLNVRGAYSPDDQTLVVIEDTVSCDAQMVCQLLQKLRATHPDRTIPLMRNITPSRHPYPCRSALRPRPPCPGHCRSRRIRRRSRRCPRRSSMSAGGSRDVSDVLVCYGLFVLNIGHACHSAMRSGRWHNRVHLPMQNRIFLEIT